MAKQTWNNPIDKNVDWGGDDATGGLPVSGAMIQKFIKESLDGKAGLFYYDTANNRYLVFADSQTKDEYLDDPTKTDLILGTFDAPFNYSAEINLATPTYNAVYLGATGNYLDFTYDIKNKQNASTGENVVITYTFIRNSTKQTFSQVGAFGANIHFNIDKYLGEGVNTIIIGVTGQTSLAATTTSLTYNVVNLQIADETDITVAYDLSKGVQILETGVTVAGSGTKIVEWFLDGEQLEFVKSEDEVVEPTGYRPKTIELANLQQGRHSLQIRAFVSINGDRFYTPTLYRDIMVYTGADDKPLTALALEIPAEYGLVENSEPILYGVTQYVPYTLKFSTYSPKNAASIEVAIAMDNETLGSVSSKNGIINEFTIIANKPGNKAITLSTASGVYSILAVIAPTTMDIEEIEGAVIDFRAAGNKGDSWSYGEYTGTFSGFDWNAGSGWVDSVLRINAGASFAIDYAPLANDPVGRGRTLEFEFMTTNVNDDNAVICDLTENGVGLLITATKVSLTSDEGKVIETEFKANENVRVGIVINRATSSTRKGLAFIYANGSVSRCVNFGVNDNFEAGTQIKFDGTAGAEVDLKAIRIYETALTDDNMLNNYILYRDSVAEMNEVYDRNNVYIEGTTTFSPDKMVSRLPVMIVTGDIPTLEATSDKDTQIIVDIEYTNMQDPSRSFKMVGAAMRPQGTSSMGYPKKNFRIYTQKVANTILYDANGKIVPDKLYSFKSGAIPVDCWCLKADYAESSGTHNTGIARMWNDALYNMQIDGEYVCRTDAQKSALAAGYPYDVRTTIDGFPILMFYRRNATDEPIFIGKYNFNNDKSTEKVFGFTDIPGFNNERMQCWEVLNNGNAIGLFTDVSNFYNNVTEDGETKKGWEFAFESRYPDTKTPNTDDLYAFATWMNGVNGNAARFATEKWEHFKIYPMAAYYCYLMRHAAADQLVKNAMLTSEDGQHFYFILYDNDTINGLINTGDIDILPTDNRESKDESGEYKFAGHSSVLWNMLEADAEFMQIVKNVDNALYSAGISYKECVRIFDEQQADKWVERVYNQDSEYKYVGPYVNNGINNLFMLQGKRDLHRRWWLSKRFSIYDAKFVSGEYKSQAVELKCMNDTPAGQKFTVTAGYPLDYGYGINAAARQTGISLAAGESYEFTTSEVVNLGDPIRIYGAPNIAELDLSKMANRLAVVSIANVRADALGTKFKKLILGGEGVNNMEVAEISGLKQAKLLTHLDIRGMRGISSIDLTSQPYFEELKAIGSEIGSVTFAKGAPVNRLELPSTMKTLSLEQLPYLTAENLVLENVEGLHTINIKECPSLTNDFAWIKTWYDSKATVDAKCSLIMDNVLWENVNLTDLANLTKLGTLELKGKVVLTEITLEQYNILLDAFGETAFDKNSDFYIDAPAAVFVTGRTTLVEGESEQYNVVVFGAELLSVTWSIASGSNSYVSLSDDGLLTTAVNGSNINLTIRAIIDTSKGRKTVDTSVTVKAIEYPTSSNTSILGNGTLENKYETYTLSYPPSVNGKVTAVWSLTGLDEYAEIVSQDNTSCVIKKLQESALSEVGTLTCALSKANGTSLFSVTKSIEVVNPNIAETDAGICKALYDAGLCANETFVTKIEAAAITAEQLKPNLYQDGIFHPQRDNIKSFNGFQYFTSVTTIRRETFKDCKFTSIKFPDNIQSIGDGAFSQCSKLESIQFPDGITEIPRDCCGNCYALKEAIIPESVTTIRPSAFKRCYYLDIVIPKNVTYIYWGAYAGCFSSNRITCYCLTAPTVDSDTFGSSSDYTGKSVKDQGLNTLYVPANATGYEEGYWLDPLCNADKCGFTLSKTL